MHLRLHDLAAGEDRVAEFATPPDVARGEVAVETGARLQLRELIAKARLPRLAMHFLQGHDVRVEALDRLGDVPHMIAVDQLIVARDVVGHHDERPALGRKTGPLRKADERAVLVARQQAQARVDRPWPALAGTDGEDEEDPVENGHEEEGERAEDQSSLGGRHQYPRRVPCGGGLLSRRALWHMSYNWQGSPSAGGSPSSAPPLRPCAAGRRSGGARRSRCPAP